MMTPEQKRIALAELDGWKQCEEHIKYNESEHCLVEKKEWHNKSKTKWLADEDMPDYLNSYDAIVPLIQKQSNKIKDAIGVILWQDYSNLIAWHCYYDATPEQLCDATLKATSKWKE